MLDLFFSAARLDREDFACSLRMMLVKEGTKKEKKGLDFFFEKSRRFVKIACSDGLCAPVSNFS